MKLLIYTSYKEHCKLHTEIHGSIAVNRCQIELARKDIILLSSVSVIFYGAGSRTGLESNSFIKFSLSAGTYSIDDSKAKIKAAISLCDSVFDSFFKLFLCFHAVSTGYIQLFCKF